MKINCLIVDDEPVARKGLAEYVAEVNFLNLVATCENALKASEYLHAQSIDLIYLDIHMPKISGIDFLKSLQHPPTVVFTTAFSEYALEGYSLDVVDYLVKPITFERFLKSAQKAFEICSRKQQAVRPPEQEPDHFFVKCDSKFEKVLFQEVRYVEAMQNYVVIHVAGRKLITYLTMSGLEQQLPPSRFLKVHKSYIISVAHVNALDGNEVVIGDARIPISRNLKDDVVNQILGNKLFKR
jgi:DNA-binding LytR/AlgR family response regulator